MSNDIRVFSMKTDSNKKLSDLPVTTAPTR